MARRQQITMTPQEEIQALEARLAQLKAGGTTTNQQTRERRLVEVRLKIPENELQPLNYCTREYQIKHPDLSEAEARGNFLVQGVHTARPRMERQAQARLNKQIASQQRAGAQA